MEFCFCFQDAYIAGEHPQKHTLAKMWKLVYEMQVGAWLMLHSFPPDDKVCEPRVLCVVHDVF